ncbi:hypothetical protein B0H15DRAFT_828296 [Mycena belliarum]|uniref:Translational machinery component n=1 Tax=Mycena belliarum TaxID=1033014 RepID=A0AAD6U9E0_9AGAR|nr:hypothetical protein B0H15DRAFT_828296 [Mycena belliae]
MFALRRSSRRLPTSVPFLRPPRAFSDQAHPNSFGSRPPPQPSTPPTPTWGNFTNTDTSTLISETGGEMLSKASDSTAALPHDYAPPPTDPNTFPWRLHCDSSRTNTKNTLTDPRGNVIAWFSGGSCGFRKRNRSSYEAGYQCAVRMFEKIAEKAEKAEAQNPMNIDLFLKGFGQGRDALMKALMTAQGDEVRDRIVSITDRTPIKIGGTRARKMKRR